MARLRNSNPIIESRPEMVRWFQPLLLMRIAKRAIISAIFGEYADQRIVQSAVDDVDNEELVKRYDYSDQIATDEIWIDYVADIGDGFDPTFAVASLLAKDSLKLDENISLPAGQILIFGGDEVYPFATRDEYELRTFQPYRDAFPSEQANRRAFAIPGNHDWYDGLVAFDYHFCKARDGFSDRLQLGGWYYPQHRSYFAIKLPHDWWIWGADIQLNQYLDTGQIQYFRRISETMGPSSKVILCMPQPSWLYAKRMGPEWSYRNLSRISEIALSADAKIMAVIAGDVHNYSRYHNSDLNLNLFTSGGGGAYLHPTHQLKDSVDVNWRNEEHAFTLRSESDANGAMNPTKKRACFPSQSQSKSLTWRSLGFIPANLSFCFTLGLIYWLVTYLFRNTIAVCISGSEGSSKSTLTGTEQSYLVCPGDFTLGLEWTLRFIGDDLLNNPLFFVCILGSLITLIFYVDSKHLITRFIIGGTHWIAHMVALFGGYIGVNLLNKFVYNSIKDLPEDIIPKSWPIPNDGTADTYLDTAWHYIAFPFEMIFIGMFVGGLIWSLYFFLTCRFGKIHWDHAFSSQRIKDYKNFLRMKIEPDRLTIYPIGINRVPRRFGWRLNRMKDAPTNGDPTIVPRKPINSHLIENPIIVKTN